MPRVINEYRAARYAIRIHCHACNHEHFVDFANRAEFMQLVCLNTGDPILPQKLYAEIWDEFQRDLISDCGNHIPV